MKTININNDVIPPHVLLVSGYPFVRNVAGVLNISNSRINFLNSLMGIILNFLMKII
jgi:hypothetical protein